MKKKIKIIVLFFILAFLLNLFWEISHSPLYDWNKKPLRNDVNYYITRILYSSAGDLFLIIIIFSLLSIKNKNIIWINKPKKIDYLIIIISGLFLAVVIELRAITEGRWFYSPYMPTLFGIGLTPLFQLFTTFIIALGIIRINNY
ncbi:MAG: hypothetical protein AABW75_02480 [Nanoarchaeota archaeon]